MQAYAPGGPSIFLIQELLDSIIDWPAPSSPDLRSCALISKSWVNRAQSHLFSVASFTPEYSRDEYERGMLAFQTCPHLAQFVRHIKVSTHPHWLTLVSSILFPNVREITIRSGGSRHNEMLLRSMRGGVSIIQTYLRLPDMERVTFIGFFPISILDNYFEDCSRNITALSLNLRNIGNPPEPVPTRTLIDQQRPKIQLSHLYLFNSKIMTQWLLQRNTFAFSCLRSVEMDDQTWVSLQDSLKSSLRSIESLILTNFTNPTHLDLTKLPALRLLDVCIRPDHHEWLMSTLLRPSAHPNLRIITIRIDIQIYEEYSYTFERFRSNASAIAAVHPVQRVDFHHNTNLHQKESMKSFFASDVV